MKKDEKKTSKTLILFDKKKTLILVNFIFSYDFFVTFLDQVFSYLTEEKSREDGKNLCESFLFSSNLWMNEHTFTQF